MARGLSKATVEQGLAVIAAGQRQTVFTNDEVRAILVNPPSKQSFSNKMTTFIEGGFITKIENAKHSLVQENLNDFLNFLNGGPGTGTPNNLKVAAVEEWPSETLNLYDKHLLSLMRVASEEDNEMLHLKFQLFLERYIGALTTALRTLKRREVVPLTEEDKDSDNYLTFKTWLTYLDEDSLKYSPPVETRVFEASEYKSWPEFKRELALAFTTGDQQATRDKWSKINRLRYLGEDTEEFENEPAFDYNEANARRAKIARDRALEKLAVNQSAERRIKEIDSHFPKRDPDTDGWDDEEDYQGAVFYAEQDQQLFEWFCDLSSTEQRHVYDKFQDKTDMYYKPFYGGFTELMVNYLKGPPC